MVLEGLFLAFLLNFVRSQTYYTIYPSNIDKILANDPYNGIYYMNACECDRITWVCEPDCCCDSDCKFDSTDKCSNYIKQTFNDSKYLCDRDDISKVDDTYKLFEYFSIGPKSASMFCVATQNLADIVKYHDNNSEWSKTEQVSLLLNQDADNPMIDQFLHETIDQTDTLASSMSSLAFIGLNGFMGDCGYTRNVKTYSSSFTCSLDYADIKSSCLNSRYLNGISIFQNLSKFNFRKKDYSTPTNIGSIYYFNEASFQSSTNLTAPSFKNDTASCSCDNAVKGLTYNFYYENDFDFKEVTIDFSLGKIIKPCSESFRIDMELDYRFYNITQYPAMRTQVTEISSGNPGYNYNKPLKAASFKQSGIQLYKDYIPFVGVTSSGATCSTSASDKILIPIVKFAQGLTISCSISQKVSSVSCKDINNSIVKYSILGALDGIYFARLARPDINTAENWITPTNVKEILQPSFTDSICRNVISSITLIFQYKQIDDRSGFYISDIKKSITYTNIPTGSSGQHVLKFTVAFETETKKIIGNGSSNYVKQKFDKLLFFISSATIKFTIHCLLTIVLYNF